MIEKWINRIGYVQCLTKLPEALVLTHTLGACLLVIAVVRAVVLSRTTDPLPAD